MPDSVQVQIDTINSLLSSHRSGSNPQLHHIYTYIASQIDGLPSYDAGLVEWLNIAASINGPNYGDSALN